MQRLGYPIKKTPLEKARAALNAFDKHAAHDLERAYLHDPSMASEAAGGRTQRSIRALQMEAEVRANPIMRADRFVDEWTGLNAQRLAAKHTGDRAMASRIGDDMYEPAHKLERDPQMELLLRNRRKDLGLGNLPPFERSRSLSNDLTDSIGFGKERERGLGISM